MVGPKPQSLGVWGGGRKTVDEMNYGVEITEPAAHSAEEPPKKGATFGGRRITSPEEDGI